MKIDTECDQCAWVNGLVQQGPSTFHLRAFYKNATTGGPLLM